MHRDVVTHVAVSSADFFITGSVDGTILSILCLRIACVCLVFVVTIIN